MTVLTETPPSIDLTTTEEAPPVSLTADLAWCLERFVTGRADEPAMRRAEQALTVWAAWNDGPGAGARPPDTTIDLTST